jgi:hypothetical protein
MTIESAVFYNFNRHKNSHPKTMSLFGTGCHGLSQGDLQKVFEKATFTEFSV